MPNISNLVLTLPAIILALTVHELCHGLMAYKLGDTTAKHDGRLSLNPMRHIDPIGIICLLFLHFGWAKPVMVNPGRFSYPKFDMALTAFAGPLSNFITALITTLIFYPLANNIAVSNIITSFLYALIIVNISLGTFNMLPIPPLDGSKIFAAILPDKLYFQFISFGSRFGMILLLILVWTNLLSGFMSNLISFIFNAFITIAKTIYG